VNAVKIAITESRNNPVLKRKELTVSIDYENGATASKPQLQEALSRETKIAADCIEICKILSEVGRPFGTALIHVWETAELVPKPKPKKAAKPA
jgi:ribosomal protein S24E